MPDGVCGPLDALLILLVALLAVAAAVRRSRRRVCRMCKAATDRRAWRFCRSCGAPRNESDKAGAKPPGAKTVAVSPLTGERLATLPSQLLRRGWRRDEEALDDCGHEVAANDERAVAWSLLGACDRAFEPHSRPWRAWRQGLDDILRERCGGVSARVWARHPARRHQSVVALAQEVERRMGLASDGDRNATKG